MTKLIYLKDSYKKWLKTKIISVSTLATSTQIILKETVFYPQGGGQPADWGEIKGINGKLTITHVRLKNNEVIHEGKLTGSLKKGDDVVAEIDWNRRFNNMRRHSAGHILHEIVMQTVSGLTPIKGEHGIPAFIEYRGNINPKLAATLEKQTNMLIAEDRMIKSEFVTLEELKKRAAWTPAKLPGNKPLRIVSISGFAPIPDGGTQVRKTAEVLPIKITGIEKNNENVRVYYEIELSKNHFAQDLNQSQKTVTNNNESNRPRLTLNNFRTLVLELQDELMQVINQAKPQQINDLKIRYFGSHGKATLLIKRLKDLLPNERKAAGALVNEFKKTSEDALNSISNKKSEAASSDLFVDTSLPGVLPPQGHLHIVTLAIMEITRIFERLGFTRVRHPEVDWDWYAFESLNMPEHHPARDEWETFFIESSANISENPKFKQIVLTPHTSNGQVREMEKGSLPIRMINIAKCYRRQSDVSHVPMFHQFEGLYIDKHVSVGHLKGVFDFFVKQFYGGNREIRLRPFHFQFTEPSFEVDINCGICLGRGCKLCKSGWLELGGAGIVHPQVLKNGGIDPDIYNGFAFGWGIERTYMMKSGTQLDDIRLLYSNDLRFLNQF